MSTDWRRVRRLFEAALERPAGERAEFVDRECGPDAALREQVLGLLEQESAPATVETPRGDEVFGGSDPVPRLHAGELGRIGPWELRRPLGAGGMGDVYLAVRADGQFQRQVAIKVIRRGLDHTELLRRFQRERQVQANLDHPGIARMLDAGVTEGGLPYLVLEYVEGLPIDRYCDENRLSAEERIELFRKVCDAVHHAHQNLVVHRDLKPSNILVNAAGEPKLLDFGIAKVLDPEKAAGIEVTQAVMRFMTPTYASPEQVRHRPVTTASDVYSLGVILYQLLTGHLPLDLGTGTPAEIERVVCEVDPPRPSTVITRARELPVKDATSTSRLTPELVSSQRLTTPRALVRALSGDLDSVVLMAMRKEPHRRYRSAAELSEDLRRYVAGLPVTARPDTALYRASKFVRRNRVAVVAGVLLLTSLVAGLVLTLRARSAERDQRRLAERNADQLQILAADLELERQKAEERAETLEVLASELERERSVAQQRLEDVRSFSTSLIFDIAQRVIVLEGAAPAMRVLCETGVRFLDKLRQDAGDDPSFLRELAIAYARLGEVQAAGAAGRPGGEGSAEVLATHERGVEIAGQAMELEPEDPRNAYALATCLTQLGRLQMTLWEPELAEASLRHAVAVCEEGIGPVSEPAVGHLFTWWACLRELATCLEYQLRAPEAAELVEPATEVLERLQARWPHFPAVRSAEVELARWHADIERRRGELDLAVEHVQRAVELQEAIVQSQPSARARRDLWVHRMELVGALSAGAGTDHGGSLPGLIELIEGARDFFQTASRAAPEDVQPRFDLMTALELLADLRTEAGDFDSARDAAAGAAGLARRLLEVNPDDPTARFKLVGALLHGSDAARRAGALSEARELATEARVLLEDALLREDRRLTAEQMTWRAYVALALVCRSMAEQVGEAEAARRESAARSREWFHKALTALERLEGRAGPSEELRLTRDRVRADLRTLEAIELAFD